MCNNLGRVNNWKIALVQFVSALFFGLYGFLEFEQLQPLPGQCRTNKNKGQIDPWIKQVIRFQCVTLWIPLDTVETRELIVCSSHFLLLKSSLQMHIIT